MTIYDKITFNKYNIAPKEAARISIFDDNNTNIGYVNILEQMIPKVDVSTKLYTFGAISDVHILYETAQEDFQNACEYFNENVEFVCISGDLTADGSRELLEQYKQAVETYSNIPIYAVSGNHEGMTEGMKDYIYDYTGHPLCYTFTKGNDVFIMVGVASTNYGELFTEEELQWLYETLEKNRNKRCFLFEHVFSSDGCGNALGVYPYNIWGGKDKEIFESLLLHYKNVIWFHGHSHLKFQMLNFDKDANICETFGMYCIHIPSISVPRGITSIENPELDTIYAESEGYVVEVYEDYIHLKGMNFITNSIIPCAYYELETNLQTIEENTYSDPTGLLNTNKGEE